MSVKWWGRASLAWHFQNKRSVCHGKSIVALIAMCILSPVESFIPGYNATHEINGLLKAKREARSNLRWAYNEAVALCKQYGELLEDMRDFLQTGTSGVGECSLLIEQDLIQ